MQYVSRMTLLGESAGDGSFSYNWIRLFCEIEISVHKSKSYTGLRYGVCVFEVASSSMMGVFVFTKCWINYFALSDKHVIIGSS